MAKEMKRTISNAMVLIILITILSVHFINIEIVKADQSNNYYIANHGDDSNDGLSPSKPWQTITKINAELKNGCINIGDDIFFNRGDIFVGELDLRKGGIRSNQMIIGAYGIGDRPIIKNPYGLGNNNGIIIWWDESNYYTIQDLQIKDVISDGIDIAQYNRNNITIKNIYCENLSGGKFIYIDKTIGYIIENCVSEGAGIYLYGDINNRLGNGKILNCTVANHTGDCFQLHKANSATNNYDAGSNHYFYNCTAYNSISDGFDIVAGQNIILKNCTVWNNSHCGIVVGHDITNVTIENCYIKEGGTGNMLIGDANNVIIRNNIVHNLSAPLFSIYPSNGSAWEGEDGYLKNCTVYNNVFLYSKGTNWNSRLISINFNYFNDINLKNNIFATLDSSNPNKLFKVHYCVIPPSNKIHFDNNLWYHGSDSNEKLWNNGSNKMSLTDWNNFYPNDFFSNPHLNDPYNYDFSLSANSPCIDNATWLTKTNGNGNSSIITVDDATYFTDGFGIIYGDIIQIGSNKNIKILNIDYNSNTLTINRSIKWNDDEKINFPYSGSGPDIGIKEFNQNIDNEPSIIERVSFSISNPIDTNPDFGWVNISCDTADDITLQMVTLNITQNDGIWNNISLSLNNSNIHYYNTSTIFSQYGNYTFYFWCKENNMNTKTSKIYNFSMPPNWDINNDGQCNILDHLLISEKYGLTGMEGWIREDVNNDGEISLIDLVIISNHYQEKWHK